MRALPDAARLDRMFFALAETNRRGLLERLGRGPASVSELADSLGLALPSAVKHLAVLEEGGFVVSQKSGRVRTFAAEPAAMATLERWVATRKAQLNTQFDRLDAYLADQKGKSKR